MHTMSKPSHLDRLAPLILSILAALIVIGGVAYGVHQWNEATARFQTMTGQP